MTFSDTSVFYEVKKPFGIAILVGFGNVASHRFRNLPFCATSKCAIKSYKLS